MHNLLRRSDDNGQEQEACKGRKSLLALRRLCGVRYTLDLRYNGSCIGDYVQVFVRVKLPDSSGAETSCTSNEERRISGTACFATYFPIIDFTKRRGPCPSPARTAHLERVFNSATGAKDRILEKILPIEVFTDDVSPSSASSGDDGM